MVGPAGSVTPRRPVMLGTPAGMRKRTEASFTGDQAPPPDTNSCLVNTISVCFDWMKERATEICFGVLVSSRDFRVLGFWNNISK